MSTDPESLTELLTEDLGVIFWSIIKKRKQKHSSLSPCFSLQKLTYLQEQGAGSESSSSFPDITVDNGNLPLDISKRKLKMNYISEGIDKERAWRSRC